MPVFDPAPDIRPCDRRHLWADRNGLRGDLQIHRAWSISRRAKMTHITAYDSPGPSRHGQRQWGRVVALGAILAAVVGSALSSNAW